MNETKLFIVEGPDGAGKSTIAKTLAWEHRLTYKHLRFFEDKNQLDKQFEDVFDDLLNFGDCYPEHDGLVFDRFIYSNYAYQDRENWSKWLKQINRLMGTLKNFANITYIWCIPANEEEYLKHYKKLTQEREEFVGDDIEKMKKIYRMYKCLQENTECDDNKKYKNVQHRTFDIILEKKYDAILATA